MIKLTAENMVAGDLQLFSLPDLYFQVSEMINNPRYTAVDIGQVISKDPGLSARLLRVVNSSFYGFQAKIDTISRAITIVGVDDLKNLVLATTVIDKFSKNPAELIDMTDFWLRSVHCGVIARALAKESSVLHSERLFLAGLLHDLGSLVLYYRLPDKSLEVLLAADYDRKLVAKLEYEMIGFTHAKVGSVLIKSWSLPESLSESIAYYLNPEVSQAYKLDVYLLSMAVKLADCAQQNISIEKVMAGFSDEALAIICLDVEKVSKAVGQAEFEFSQVFELLAPGKKFY
jgi:HD-like signal output (HDOD) protein